MKGRKTRKLLSLLLTAALAVMMMTTFVSAATTYTAIPGTSTTFDKYLILPADATVPAATFSFTIAGGTAVEGSDTELAVYSGSDQIRTYGSPSVGTAIFAAGNTTYTSAQSGDTISLGTNQKYAVQVVTVDFSTVTYKEPGVYRYTITETAGDIPGMTYDVTPKTLDVYVEDAGDGTLRIGNGTEGSGYVLYNTVIDTAPSKTVNDVSASKATGFTNSYDAHNLTISKAVSGNQASRDEYFEFTINITGAAPSSTIAVDITNADGTTTTNGVNTETHTNAPSFVTGTDGAAVVTYWLQHGQSIEIKGLSDSAKYTVTENATTLTDEGYTAEITISGDTDAAVDANDSFKAADSSTGIKADTTVAYTNTKDGVIPTGIILSVAGLLIVGIIAVIGFVFFGIRSKKRYDED